MKNQYFGDINDYRKYSLLRILSETGSVAIGICWMLTPDDGRTDGQSISYLEKPRKWRNYDPPLFDHLYQALIADGTRSVKLIQDERILPGFAFWDKPLTDSSAARSVYFSEMRRQFSGKDLIFFDPDNGIEISSRPRGNRNSAKYVYWDELMETYQSGQSVLVYQHFPRENRSLFINRIASEFRTRLGAAGVFWFQTAHMVYFLAAQQEHLASVDASMERINQSWGKEMQIMVGKYEFDVQKRKGSPAMFEKSRNILLMVHELHKMGYQRIRIMPGMSPSGIHWRCSISPAVNFRRGNEIQLENWDKLSAHYSSGQDDRYFDWDDAIDNSPKELALKFVERFPEIARYGRGNDWEYAGWYLTMLQMTEPSGLPIAYADWELPSDGLAVIGMEGDAKIPLPPDPRENP